NGALLKNHGVIAVGESLSKAYVRAEIIETVAQLAFGAKMIGRWELHTGTIGGDAQKLWFLLCRPRRSIKRGEWKFSREISLQEPAQVEFKQCPAMLDDSNPQCRFCYRSVKEFVTKNFMLRSASGWKSDFQAEMDNPIFFAQISLLLGCVLV